jgi:predicted RNase H-like HicB family nuclease
MKSSVRWNPASGPDGYPNPMKVRVKYRQDPDTRTWTATVPEVPGVVSQGRTLREAHDRVRNALTLVRPDAHGVLLFGDTELGDRPELPMEVLNVIKQESDLRVHLMQIQDELERSTREAVTLLVRQYHFSYSDVGEVLGITKQRVEQIYNFQGEAAQQWTTQAFKEL